VYLTARISFHSILLAQIPRLVEAVWYQAAMRRARVPEKNIRRIMRRWGAWRYVVRKECEGLVRDMERSWSIKPEGKPCP
jgi:hypothetical protein